MKMKINARMCAVGLTLVALPLACANDAEKDFAMMDTNGDGRITRAEHAAAAKKMFAMMDKNNDGIVTAAEMDAMKQMKHDDHDAAEMSSAEKIKEIDTDGDGRITAAEHAAGSEKMFDKMDTNHDGVLSKEECVAGHKTLMKK